MEGPGELAQAAALGAPLFEKDAAESKLHNAVPRRIHHVEPAAGLVDRQTERVADLALAVSSRTPAAEVVAGQREDMDV